MKRLLALGVIVVFLGCKDEVDTPPSINTPENATLTLQLEHYFNAQPLYLDTDSLVTNAAGNVLNFRTLKYLISNITLVTTSDSSIVLADQYGYLNPGDNRNSVSLEKVPKGQYKSLRFQIGLDSSINHGNPNIFAAGHPLNPNLNNMHWSWSRGYIFCTLEGECTNTPSGKKAFSYHIALNENKIRVNMPDYPFALQKNSEMTIRMQLDEAFKNPNTFDLNAEGFVSHSTNDKGLCNRLRDNMSDAFSVISVK